MIQDGTLKVVAAFLTFGVAALGGLVSSVYATRDPKAHQILNVFSGGIFLAGSFVHLLPDAVNNNALRLFGSSTDKPVFPWAYALYGIGYLMIFLLEKFAHYLQVQRRRSEERIPLKTCDGTVAHTHSEALFDQVNVLSLAIFIALSFHSVMEGMGIGSQSKPWAILIAVLTHKGMASFALATELSKHGVAPLQLFGTILVFSCMTPIGIGLGWWISSADSDSVATGVCLSLAAGTFLYVSVMEILPEAFQDHHDIGIKCVALCSGFFVFALLAIWV